MQIKIRLLEARLINVNFVDLICTVKEVCFEKVNFNVPGS